MEILIGVVVLVVLVASMFYGIGEDNGYERRKREEWGDYSGDVEPLP